MERKEFIIPIKIPYNSGEIIIIGNPKQLNPLKNAVLIIKRLIIEIRITDFK